MKILTLFLCFISLSALAETPWQTPDDDPFRLIGAHLGHQDYETLFRLGKIQNINDLLSATIQELPIVRIIVLPSGDQEIGSKSKVWTDRRVNPLINKYYSNHQRKLNWDVRGHTYGQFIPPGRDIEGMPGRPLKDKALILLDGNIERASVFHELVHFFIDLSYRAKSEEGTGHLRDLLYNRSQTVTEQAFLAACNFFSLKNGEAPNLTPLIKSLFGGLTKLFEHHIIYHGEEIAVTQTTHSLREPLGLTFEEAQAEVNYGLYNILELKKKLNEILQTALFIKKMFAKHSIENSDSILIEETQKFSQMLEMISPKLTQKTEHFLDAHGKLQQLAESDRHRKCVEFLTNIVIN